MTATAIVPDLYTLDVQAANGTPFRVLAIPPGAVGPNRFRAPADRGYTLVEFYDRRHLIDGEHGQFTGGGYRLDALMARQRHIGLNLCGGEPEWQVDADAMELVRAWLVGLLTGGALAKR